MYTSVKFQRVRNVKLPKYSTDGSAGLDFFIPDDVEWESKNIAPGESVNIPSGIKLELPAHVCLVALNKSGNGSKGLNCGAVLSDPDYRGELHLNVFNVSKNTVTVRRGEKLIQFLAVEFLKLNLYEDTLTPTERGEKGFGSTGAH